MAISVTGAKMQPGMGCVFPRTGRMLPGTRQDAPGKGPTVPGNISCAHVHTQIIWSALALLRPKCSQEYLGAQAMSAWIESLRVFDKNPIPYSGFIRNGESFSKSVLLFLFIVLAEIPY